ncbi:MAG: type II toxin-antitoxin system VapB family antitoxin [Thermocrispum sp.]
MAMNIKDRETERLVSEVAQRTGKTKTAVVREAVRRELERLEVAESRRPDDFLRFLQEEIWPQISPEHLGKPLTREEEDEIMGYGPGGV